MQSSPKKYLVLDTGCLENSDYRLRKLSNRLKVKTWQALAEQHGRQIAIPEIVKNELFGHFKLELKRYLRAQRGNFEALSQLSPNRPALSVDEESVIKEWIEDYQRLGWHEVKHSKTHYEDAIKREIEGIAPARTRIRPKEQKLTPAEGGRDSLVWAAALELATSPVTDVLLVSSDRNAFGDLKSPRPALTGEINSSHARGRLKVYFDNDFKATIEGVDRTEFSLRDIEEMGTHPSAYGLNHHVANELMGETKSWLSARLPEQGFELSPYAWVEDRGALPLNVIPGTSRRVTLGKEAQIQWFEYDSKMTWMSTARPIGESMQAGTAVSVIVRASIRREIFEGSGLSPATTILASSFRDLEVR